MAKYKIAWLRGGAGILLVILVASHALAQPRNIDIKREFMRQKLEFSKNILNGLVLEQFDLVALNALRLRNLSASNNGLWSTIRITLSRQRNSRTTLICCFKRQMHTTPPIPSPPIIRS
jgi:hypothetical protein